MAVTLKAVRAFVCSFFVCR